jgi:uncharacterized protein YegJ (DUF2314 family)
MLWSRTLILCAVASSAGALFPLATWGATLSEESCSVLATHDGEPPAMREVPGLTILNRRADDPLTLVGVDGVTIKGVVCWRSEARLAENDYLVADAGFPFYVKTDRQDESANRTLVLEGSGASFRVRLLSGPSLTDEEKTEIQRLLSLYNTKQRGASKEASAVASAPVPQLGPLAPNRPQDKPHAVVDPRADDEAIAPYVARAQKTYPDAKRRYLKGLPSGCVFFVTTRIRDSDERWEQVFVRVQTIQGDLITGVISNQLTVVHGFRAGQVYSFKERELLDWLIANPDGSEEGNVVGKFWDSLSRPKT